MSAQKFTAITTIGVPVGVADANKLNANVVQIANLSNRQVLAISVVSLCYLLHSYSGVDYRTNLGLLQSDSGSMLNTFTPNDFPDGGSLLSRMAAVIDWNAGYEKDSSLTTDVGTILGVAKGLPELPESTLWLEILFLRHCLSIKQV